MPLDFGEIKQRVRIADVLAKRGIPLRYNGEWGSARCPLPTHKPGEKDRTFQVNTAQNYFKCWSASCNEKAGKKGGDCINLIALLDNCSEYDAAKKLAAEFHIQQKTAQHIAERSDKPTPKRTVSENSSPAVEVKYTEKVRVWFDELLPRRDSESDEDYRKRLLKAITSELIANYRSGKAGKIL